MKRLLFPLIAVMATFVVIGCPDSDPPPSQPTLGISLNVQGTHPFSAVTEGYLQNDITPLTITVTNIGTMPTGNLAISLIDDENDSFRVSPASSSLISISSGATDTFTVSPRLGLGIGTYTATVAVSGGPGIAAQSFNVTFEVTRLRMDVISAGHVHSTAIGYDGSLWVWGHGGHGRLGLGPDVTATTNILVPTRITTPNIVWSSVSAGRDFNIAIDNNGSLWAWGFNVRGQLGLGDTTDRYTPIQIMPGTTWKKVSAGFSHTLAISVDGSLWVWGDNTWGELGNGAAGGYIHTPTMVDPYTDWVYVSAENTHSMAIRANGMLYGWGEQFRGKLGNGQETGYVATPTLIGTDDDWASVSAGFTHTMAIKKDGSLWGWGDNWFGQLGNGESGNAHIINLTPINIGALHKWLSVSTMQNHTIAIRDDGSLWAWGINELGQLGIGGEGGRTLPTPVDADPNTVWLSISTGASPHSIGIQSDGSLWTWGGNGSGQLGNGDDENNLAISPAKITFVVPD